MIDRYNSRVMKNIWSDQNRFDIWLKIEILACRAWTELGKIPEESLKQIEKKASFDIERINILEKTVKHDVVAFIKCVSEFVGHDARYIHMGLTSSDILDTCLAVQLSLASVILIEDCNKLIGLLQVLALKTKHTMIMGRTHGIHAEPTTFGLKLAIWYEEMRRNLFRLERAYRSIQVGKLSGAVGTYAHCPPEIEAYVCKYLNLTPDTVSNQIIQRDRIAEYLTTLAIIGSSIEKFALEIRNLQRTEVSEVQEGFSKGQTGSSAMPHKRNPITSEKLCGLSRILRGNALASMENVALWHERDISHSSVERVICPDSTTLLHHMLHKFCGLLEGLVINKNRMVKNMKLMKGIEYSQMILLRLVELGLDRSHAYSLVQRNAAKCIDGCGCFQDHLLEDVEITNLIKPAEIEFLCSETALREYHFKHVDRIFDRVFGRTLIQ